MNEVDCIFVHVGDSRGLDVVGGFEGPIERWTTGRLVNLSNKV